MMWEEEDRLGFYFFCFYEHKERERERYCLRILSWTQFFSSRRKIERGRR